MFRYFTIFYLCTWGIVSEYPDNRISSEKIFTIPEMEMYANMILYCYETGSIFPNHWAKRYCYCYCYEIYFSCLYKILCIKYQNHILPFLQNWYVFSLWLLIHFWFLMKASKVNRGIYLKKFICHVADSSDIGPHYTICFPLLRLCILLVAVCTRPVWSFVRKTYTWWSPKSSHSWFHEIRWISCRFHVDFMKSHRLHVKSGRFHEIQQISCEIHLET